MTGLTLAEQLAHPWVESFGLVREPSGELRPRGPHFHSLVRLEEVKGGPAVCFIAEALEHPTTSPELSRLRWEFLTATLGPEAQLAEWLAGTGKEPLKVGERRLELARQAETASYTVSKARAKFWPFS
jgi:hypothetical protein